MLTKISKPFIVFFLAFSFYIYHLAPGVTWGDSAKLIINIFQKKIFIQPSSHSLHTIIGFLFGVLPIDEFAYRINLLSAFFGALTITILYSFLYHLTKSYIATISAVLSFAFSHTFFLLSVITETYTLYTFFLISIIYLLYLWQETKNNYLLYTAVFLFCLSLFNHLLVILSLPGFLYYTISANKEKNLIKRKDILPLLFSALLGLSPLLIVSLSIIIEKGFNILVSQLKNDPARICVSLLKPNEMFKECLRYISFLMYQFPLFGFVVGFIGIIKLLNYSKRLSFFFLSVFLANIVFVLHYIKQKQYSLSIGSYLIFAIFIGIGVKLILEKSNRYKRVISLLILLSLSLSPFLLYYNVIPLSKKLNVNLVKARYIPYRDNNKYFLIPSKRKEFGPYLYAEEIFKTAKLNSIIVIDFTPKMVLDYFRIVKGYRPDIKLVFVDYPFSKLDIKLVDENIDKYEIYLASIEFEKDYNLSELQKRYNLIPAGPLYRVVKANH